MRKIAAAVALVFLATACGKNESPQDTPAPAKEKSASAPGAAIPLLVSIIPEPPTADGCLKALVSGTTEAEFTWEVNGQAVSQSNQLCEAFSRGDEVRVIASFGRATGDRKMTIENAPPRITEVEINADAVLTRNDLVVRATAADIDGDPVELRYQWYVNDYADPFLIEDTLPAARYARGDKVRFTIVPADALADGNMYTSETMVVPNAPPQIVSEPPRQFEALEYSYGVEAVDPDGDPLAYALVEAPSGMKIDPESGLIRWPLVGVTPGAYSLKIAVRDTEGAEVQQAFSLALGESKLPANP